jgi:hypothetical protein
MTNIEEINFVEEKDGELVFNEKPSPENIKAFEDRIKELKDELEKKEEVLNSLTEQRRFQLLESVVSACLDKAVDDDETLFKRSGLDKDTMNAIRHESEKLVDHIMEGYKDD